jgi:hypothetical protein
MKSSILTKTALLASAVSMTVAALPSAAAAQPYQRYDPPPQGDQPPPGYNDQGSYDDDQGPPQNYNQAPPPRYSEDRGYTDNQPQPGYSDEPPPAGYDGGPPDPRQQAQDQQYASSAEAWARDNCVKSGGNVAAGAIFGGTFGAIIGGITGGGRGAAWGAGLGGLGGAALAAGSQQTSPGCPPGYVVRRDAPAFAYGPAYDYYAPAAYDPWIWYGNAWVYRPYPYHTWYYRHYGRGGGYPDHRYHHDYHR